MTPSDQIALASILATVIVAISGYIYNAWSENRRAVREAQAERRRWDWEDQTRFHKERSEVYDQLLAASTGFAIEEEPNPEILRTLIMAHTTTMRLSSPDVAIKATQLVDTCFEWTKAHRAATSSHERELAHETFVERYIPVSHDFAEATKAELGLPPLEPNQ